MKDYVVVTAIYYAYGCILLNVPHKAYKRKTDLFYPYFHKVQGCRLTVAMISLFIGCYEIWVCRGHLEPLRQEADAHRGVSGGKFANAEGRSFCLWFLSAT